MVPSSGSTTQRTPLVPARSVPSSPRMPSSGRAPSSRSTMQRLGGAVHLGDHVGAGRLRADLGAGPGRGRRAAARPRRGPTASARQAQLVGSVAVGIAAARYRRPCPPARPRRPAQRHRHPADAGDARGRWPTPRWATTASATTPPSRRLEEAFAELRRQGGRRCSCRRARWATRSPSGCSAAPGTRGRCAAAASTSWCTRPARRGRQRPAPSSSPSTTPTARSTPPRWPRGWPTPGSAGPPPSAVFVEDTHGEVGGRSWPLERLAARGRRRPARAPRRRPALERRGRLRARTAGGAGRGRHHRDVLPVEGARAPRSARCSPGPADLIGRGPASSASASAAAMRQVGILAAAGLVALDHVDRLADDHARARRLAEAAAARWPGSVDLALGAHEHRPLRRSPTLRPLLRHLADHGVLAVPGSATTVRLVTHADVDDADVDRAVGRALEPAPRDRGRHPGAGPRRVRPPRRPRGRRAAARSPGGPPPAARCTS